MNNTVNLLIDLLNDPTAREDERDDAALDLGDFDDERVLPALLNFISIKNADELLVQSCLDSIAQILTRRDDFDFNIYQKLTGWNKQYVGEYIRNVKPQWSHLVEI